MMPGLIEFMRALAVIALLFAFPAWRGAQADAPVARPEVKVGDRWTYRRMDYWKNKPGETYELRVTFAERNAIHAVVIRKDGRESDASYTSEWNTIVSPGGRVNIRERGMLQFPLQIGASYKTSWRLENPRTQAVSHNERTVKVVSWEDVVVPAGKFRALRIEAAGTYQRVDIWNPLGSALDVYWYVPEVKRWVKYFREESTNRYYGKFGEELVEFTVR